jgi:hypothetical protein
MGNRREHGVGHAVVRGVGGVGADSMKAKKTIKVPSHPDDIVEAQLMMIEALRKRRKCSLLEAAAIVRRCWAKAAMEYAAQMKAKRTKEK